MSDYEFNNFDKVKYKGKSWRIISRFKRNENIYILKRVVKVFGIVLKYSRVQVKEGEL